MRLIDADTLESYGLSRFFDDYAFDVIDKMPTIDAVQVVRCKDCNHSYGWKSVSEEEMFYHKVSKTRGFCKELKEHSGLSIMVGEENFCCWGERRER